MVLATINGGDIEITFGLNHSLKILGGTVGGDLTPGTKDVSAHGVAVLHHGVVSVEGAFNDLPISTVHKHSHGLGEERITNLLTF